MHTKTLTVMPCQFGIPYFRSNWDPWLCIRTLKKHVELPDICPKVRLVSTPHEPLENYPNYWDLNEDGTLVGVRAQLTVEFKRWNMGNYGSGDRYVYLEIVE